MTRHRAAVLFDLYGTLVDLHVDEKSTSVWNAIATDFFGTVEDVSGTRLRESYFELAELQGRQKEEGFLLDSVFSQLLPRFGVPSSPEAIRAFASIFRKHSIVYLKKKAYTDPLLREIRASGYRLGLISNTEELVTHYDLDVLQLEPAFDDIALSSDIGIKKPHTKIFTEMLARLRVGAAAATYVGNDFDDDVLGALNSGMDAVYLTAEPDHVREVIERRYAGRVLCAEFSLESIRVVLNKLCYKFVGRPR